MNSGHRQATLSEEFERVAQAHPRRLAVVDAEHSLSYEELDRRADRAAFELRASGVPAGGLVGLSAGRSVDLIVGILAILKAGAAYVPLDPALPADRRRYIVEDSGLGAVLTDRQDHAPDTGRVPVVSLTGIDPAGPVLPRDDRDADGLAYVIYTSGSTGAPKGVMVEHRQVLALFDGADQEFRFGPDDTWTLFHSYAFDFSVWEIFGALLHGGCLVVVPQEATRSPEAMWKLIQREGVTVLSQTPSYFARLLQADQGFGDGLRYVVFGGEALEFARLGTWYERYGNTGPLLVNMYGITETTVHVTYRPLGPEDVTGVRSVIGRPLPHLTVQLLDTELRPVAAGEAGEICVGGAGLARGYLGREELTAERFVADPRQPGARLYRSGDLGRLLDTGELEYLGRSDQQVKVRGYRIEPGEVQHCLAQHPAVADVVVTTRDLDGSDAQLVAYLVARPGAVLPPAAELREHAGRTLPGYMIPSWFVPIDRIPVNHNGKLDRAALPDPGTVRAPGSAPDVRAAGPAGVLLAIWQDVLDVAGITVDDHFYAVGGDSIRAIRVVAAARAQQLAISVDDLLGNPTVAELAAALDTRDDIPADPRTEVRELLTAADRAALPTGVTDAYPVTSLQMGMLFHTDGPGSTAYHSVSTATVNLALDADRLRACLGRLTTRHEALRTSFDLANFSVPLQLVTESVEPSLTVDDLTGLPSGARADAVRAVLEQERAQPLDWRSAPMIRFRVAVLGPEQFLFVWSEHHSVLDGWSSNSLFAELIADYTGAATTEGTELPPLRDYVAAEQLALASGDSRSFWSDYLRGAPATAADGPAAEQAHEAVLDLPADTYQLLQEAARSTGRTPKALLTAVVAAAIGVHRGRSEVVVGHVSHGRLDRPGGERALGLFLNILPLRIDLTGSWQDLAASASAAERVTNPHRRYPLAAIQRAAGADFRLDNLFNFTDFHQLEPLVRQGLISQDGVGNSTWTNLPLVVEAERRAADGRLTVTVQFQAAEWTADARAAFLSTLGTLLRHAVEEPAAVAVAPVCLEAESGTGPTAVDDIVAQAATRPDRIAVADGRTALGYGELVRRTRALALLLRSHGVGPGSVVGMCLPRTVDLLVASLAVYWTGAALVPLEPDYPLERRRFTLDDAGADLLLTEDTTADPAAARPTLSLGGLDWASLPDDPDFGPLCTPDDLAYVLYTSGSTGTPKGVEVAHRNLRAIMRAVNRTIGLTERDVVLGWSSVAFDMVFTEHVAALMAGARVELLTDGEVREPARVRDRCRATGVTLIEATPSKVQTLLDAGWPGADTVLCGGEALAPQLAQELLRTGAAVWNGYGPTETTVYATLYRLAEGHQGPVPIGPPLAEVPIRIVDALGTEVAEGTPGELWIGGPGVARRYLGLPELTAERFVGEGRDRYYRSGDLVRRNAAGDLEFHGRIDQQVKINGVRIELSEIEHVLAEHPAVGTVAVLLEERAGGPGLTAYVAVGTVPVDSAELRGFLADRLPAAMVPSRWLFAAALPLTTGGKIDRRRLGDRPVTAAAVPVTSARLSGPDQELVAEVWQAVLGVLPVRPDDRFFDLGGDSLTAMRAVGQFARRGVVVRAGELMEHTTVAAQAALAARGRINEEVPA